MKSARAIFIKQAKDTLKNRMVLIQFIIFPVMAFVMTEFIAKGQPDIPNSLYVTMFAAMFAGMTPLTMTSGAISEDRERKSLRFLVMAGVKPYEYLLGIGGFVLVMCSLISVIFGLIGGFSGMELFKFVSVLILGSIASAILGATIGIFSKNQQSATAISTPVFMLLSFSPLIAMFNESVKKFVGIFYTQHVNNIVNAGGFLSDPDQAADPLKSYLIIAANIAVLLVLFFVAYKKKGLRD